VEDAFEELAALAETTRRRSPAELEGARLALDAALLVDAERATRLRQTAQRAARTLAGHGYRSTMTGPWPAYSFVSDRR